MKCQLCQCVVTQDEADEAAYIFDDSQTYCPECARSLHDIGFVVDCLDSLDRTGGS